MRNPMWPLFALILAAPLSGCVYLSVQDGSRQESVGFYGVHGESYVSISTASEIGIGFEAFHNAAKNFTLSVEVRTPPPGQSQAIVVGKVRATLGRF